MRALGTSKGVIQRALEQTPDPDGRESVLSQLAFDFTGFDPGLPPLIHPTGPGRQSGLSFTIPDLRIGDWGGRRVVVHLGGSVGLKTNGEEVKLTASIDEFHADCTTSKGGITSVTPCVSDLVPTVREKIAEQPLQVAVDGGALLKQLPSMTFGAGHLELSGLRVALETEPVSLRIRTNVKISAH